jgi:hypothetical protein
MQQGTILNKLGSVINLYYARGFKVCDIDADGKQVCVSVRVALSHCVEHRAGCHVGELFERSILHHQATSLVVHTQPPVQKAPSTLFESVPMEACGLRQP